MEKEKVSKSSPRVSNKSNKDSKNPATSNVVIIEGKTLDPQTIGENAY